MRSPRYLLLLPLCAILLAAVPGAGREELPKMKFNDVKEVAPGVFFRYSSISATDDKVPFGGCNNVWVVFEDFVAVIDANFPKEAGDVLAAIRKTTDKPVRYVFDTHHHGDHAYGNAVFADAGAQIIAQTNCARLLRTDGPREFKEAGEGPMGRPDIRASRLKPPNILFDDRFVLDDGTQRIEFLHFGHGHTAGDAVAYLPKHKILCTGDACVNGAFNFMGHSDSASWIRALERMQQLDVKLICPGHGSLAGKELLEKQKRYFVDLRREVGKGVEARLPVEDIEKRIDLPWYKEWTGTTPSPLNVRHVYNELTGRVAPWDFAEDFGLFEGPSPTKETPGWKKPARVVVPSGLMPAKLAELKGVAPDVEFVPARTAEEAAKLVEDADGVVGFLTVDVLKAGKQLRWVQVGGSAADPAALQLAASKKVIVTDVRRLEGPPAADQAFALLLALTRGVEGKGPGSLTELHGKTLLLIGLGGTGTQIAKRASAFGMRVRAVDDRETERPAFVFSLDRLEKLPELLPAADVVIAATPLTESTRGLLGRKQLQMLKPTAYLVNVGAAQVVDTGALVAALAMKQLAGAGLDATDPDPLPSDHPLRKMKQVVLTDRSAGRSPETEERTWRLYRDNVRRFAAGERLLGVVEAR